MYIFLPVPPFFFAAAASQFFGQNFTFIIVVVCLRSFLARDATLTLIRL